MEKNGILEKVQEIFRDIFDNDELKITNDSSSNNIEEWDSLAHIQLIVAIEKQFNIKFTSQELISWKNVGEMIECIKKK